MTRIISNSFNKPKSLDLEGVKKLAANLSLKYKNKDVVIGLIGPLGAGKTYFTKCFALSLGIKKVKSPTFVIGSQYQISQGKLYHFDFYRLDEPKQLEALELNEILNSSNRIVLIEWVDKFPELAKKCDLLITFEITGKNTRNVTIR